MKRFGAKVLLGALLVNPSMASEIVGQITEVRGGPSAGHVVSIKMSSARLNEPSCSNLGLRGHYLIDTAKPGGKVWLDLLLAAVHGQRTVHVWGSGQCISAGALHGEELETISLQ